MGWTPLPLLPGVRVRCDLRSGALLTALPVACVDETDASTAEMSAQISREHVTFPHFFPHLSITRYSCACTSLSTNTTIDVSP